MDLGENPTLHADTSLVNGTSCATATALAQVLDSQAISSTSLATFSVSSVPGSTGLAVLTPTLDGTTTVTSLPGFTLSSFDSVDVKHVGDSSELAVATVGEDGRLVQHSARVGIFQRSADTEHCLKKYYFECVFSIFSTF